MVLYVGFVSRRDGGDVHRNMGPTQRIWAQRGWTCVNAFLEPKSGFGVQFGAARISFELFSKRFIWEAESAVPVPSPLRPLVTINMKIELNHSQNLPRPHLPLPIRPVVVQPSPQTNRDARGV